MSDHLCVVLSDPLKDPVKVVLVVLTTFEPYKDDTCLVEPGEHSFVKHPTCIAYDFFSETFPIERLETHGRREPVSPELLSRIIQGAAQTRRIPNGLWLVLNDQQII